MKKYILETAIFISGAVVMIYELAGSRLLAPYLGTSLVVWTSLIGIILGSLSLGYWWGGRLADKKPQARMLAFVLLGAAFFVGSTVFFQAQVLFFLQSVFADLRFSSIIAAVILFAPASFFFGMVSPYAVKLKLENLSASGATVGQLYAVSTVGSIFGTFVGGFFLIPFFGTVKILYILIIILALTALLVFFIEKDFLKNKRLRLFVFLFFVFGASGLGAKTQPKHIIADIDTQYNRVLIFETLDVKTGRPIRLYTTDPHGAHSAIFLDKDDDLVFDYLKFYRLANHFQPQIKKALMVGGGAYTYPQDFFKNNPEASMDIVEIDPELEKIAKQYFNFQADSRINVYNQDGRIFLNKTDNKYDCIFIDVFNSQLSLPFQMTTKETVARLHELLNSEGVVLANIISAIEGDKGKFLRAEVATYKTIFPQVYIFPVARPEDGLGVQNILLVALKSDTIPEFKNPDSEKNKQLGHLWKKEIAFDVPVLTDDYAPVDYYTMLSLND